jgi:signal transduction histidine kinase
VRIKAPLWGLGALTCLAAALACFAWVRERGLKGRAPIDAAALVSRFQAATSAPQIIDLDLEYSPEQREVLLDPASLLPRSFDFDADELGPLIRYEKTCGNPPRLPKDPELRKAHEWALFECGHARLLGDGFFARKPWIHPLGGSYVEKALGSRRREESGVAARDLTWAHALELRSAGFYLSPTQAALSELPYGAYEALRRGENAEGESIVLLRNLALGDRVYASFPKQDWVQFLTEARVRTRDCRGQESPSEGFCWENLSPSPWIRALGVLGILLLLASGFAAGHALREGKRQRRQSERQRFAFLMLAHELRTPVSALALELESLREREKRFDEHDQSAILRAYDATERLRRLSELSRRYLDASAPGLVSLLPQTLPSLHEFLREEARCAPGEVQLELEGPDRPFHTDAGWLSFCLRNLIHNAFMHGRPPVRMLLRPAHRAGEWDLRLMDEGRGVKKESASKGLGLGLSLVEKVSGELGYGFTKSEAPTCFTLHLKEMPS